MVSRPTVGTNLRFTASATIKRTLQRLRPGGGGLHTMAIILCFCPALRTGRAPGRGRSYKARSNPPCW